jgi:hypothetical protein
MGHSAVLAYRTTRVAKLDKPRQVLAPQLSTWAVKRLGEHDVEGAHERWGQCERCVIDLQSALNRLEGEELAVNLWLLYQCARQNLERAGIDIGSKGAGRCFVCGGSAARSMKKSSLPRRVSATSWRVDLW